MRCRGKIVEENALLKSFEENSIFFISEEESTTEEMVGGQKLMMSFKGRKEKLDMPVVK